MLKFLQSRIAPFRHKDFRLFFLTQSLSLIGTWSHDLARAWIVVELMGKAAALGSVLLAVAIPSLLLILHGGVLVDRLNVKKILIATKACLAVCSLAMAAIVEFSEIQMWHFYVFAILEGIVIAFDSPAFQTLTVRLVPRDDFQQAIALNSSNFHMARMAGPIVAGLLMALHGPSLVFLFDGLSFLGLIFILTRINLRNVQRKLPDQDSWAALKDGFRYFLNHRKLKYLILQLYLTICLVFPQIIVIFRTYIQEKFQLTAEQFGYLFSFPAGGAMLGAFTFTIVKPKKPVNALKVGIPFAVLLMILVPLMNTPLSTAITMGCAGFFSYLSFASLTVSLHLGVEESYRGRLGSLIGMGFISIGPIMSFPLGAYADWVGFEFSVLSLSVTFGLLSAILALLNYKNTKHLKALTQNQRLHHETKKTPKESKSPPSL